MKGEPGADAIGLRPAGRCSERVVVGLTIDDARGAGGTELPASLRCAQGLSVLAGCIKGIDAFGAGANSSSSMEDSDARGSFVVGFVCGVWQTGATGTSSGKDPGTKADGWSTARTVASSLESWCGCAGVSSTLSSHSSVTVGCIAAKDRKDRALPVTAEVEEALEVMDARGTSPSRLPSSITGAVSI